MMLVFLASSQALEIIEKLVSGAIVVRGEDVFYLNILYNVRVIV